MITEQSEGRLLRYSNTDIGSSYLGFLICSVFLAYILAETRKIVRLTCLGHCLCVTVFWSLHEWRAEICVGCGCGDQGLHLLTLPGYLTPLQSVGCGLNCRKFSSVPTWCDLLKIVCSVCSQAQNIMCALTLPHSSPIHQSWHVCGGQRTVFVDLVLSFYLFVGCGKWHLAAEFSP